MFLIVDFILIYIDFSFVKIFWDHICTHVGGRWTYNRYTTMHSSSYLSTVFINFPIDCTVLNACIFPWEIKRSNICEQWSIYTLYVGLIFD